MGGLVEQLHLAACVVYIVLALNVVSCRCLQHAGKSAAKHGSSRVSDVDRAGWVHANELDLDGDSLSARPRCRRLPS